MFSSEACNFIKRGLQHWCFPVKFAKFLRTSFFTEYFRWLLLFTHFNLLAYTYLHLSILKFSLYYYMNLIKLIKYGEYRNCDETF